MQSHTRIHEVYPDEFPESWAPAGARMCLVFEWRSPTKVCSKNSVGVNRGRFLWDHPRTDQSVNQTGQMRLSKMNEMKPELKFQLPTEAQWVYGRCMEMCWSGVRNTYSEKIATDPVGQETSDDRQISKGI